MKLLSLNSIVILLLLFGLIVPTSAVMSDSDQVWEDEGIVLSPHEGPNGQYATIDGNGNLSVDLTNGDGLNPGATTTISGIFNIANEGNSSREVWVSHDAPDRVQFVANGVGLIQGKTNKVLLDKGDSIVVGIIIDTEGVSGGTKLLSSLTVHAQSPQDTTKSGSGGSQTPTVTPTPTPTPTPLPEPEEDAVEVEFIVDVAPEDQPRVRTLSQVPDEDRGSPKAVIERVSGGRTVPPDVRAEPFRAQTLTQVDETVTLSGVQSTVGSIEAADRGRSVVKVVDITPPPTYENEPANIRIRVSRSALNGSDPTRARLARLTEDGWQLLPTRVVSQDPGNVTLQGRTPGFSVFAVLASNDVTYDWQLEGKGTFAGEELNVSYDNPGFYNATLTITDALGRTATARYRILVNDEPTVTIDRPDTIEAGEPTTLRANVTDEFGNTSIRWLFDDGTTAIGPTVTRTFQRGEEVVRVTVEDEYGATARAETTITIGGSVISPTIDVVRYALGFEGQFALLVALALALIMSTRWILTNRRTR